MGCKYIFPALTVGDPLQLQTPLGAKTQLDINAFISVKNYDSFSILVQINEKEVILTKLENNTATSIASPIQDLIDNESRLFKFHDLLGANIAKMSKVYFLTVNNNIQKLKMMECDLSTLSCKVVLEKRLDQKVSSFVPTNTGIYLNTPEANQMIEVFYGDSEDSKIIKYQKGYTSVTRFRERWIAASTSGLVILQEKNIGTLEGDNRIIVKGNISEIATTNDYIILKEDLKAANACKLTVIVERENNKWMIHSMQGTPSDMTSVFQWRNSLVFNHPNSFKILNFPLNIKSAFDENIRQQDIYRLNNSAFFTTSNLITVIPTTDGLNGLSLLSSNLNSAGYYLNHLAINSPSLDCTDSEKSNLLNKSVNFTVAFSNIYGGIKLQPYTIHFMQKEDVLDRRLIVVLVIILGLLLILAAFIMIKVCEVKKTQLQYKDELKQVEQENTSKRSSNESDIFKHGLISEMDEN